MNNNKYKILIVEDDNNIQQLLITMLEASQFQAIPAKTCSSALSLFTSHIPDFIILDLGLPDRDGTYFIQKIREQSITPILVLSARNTEADKVKALDLGANDYITKPFSSAELLARVRAILRYTRHSSTEGKLPGGQFTTRDLLIDYDRRKVLIGQEEIKLTQTEYNIVAFLSEHAGKVMTYYSIIKNIWGYPDERSIKKLQVNMANIRKKFKETPGETNYIVNELGVGYRMDDSSSLD